MKSRAQIRPYLWGRLGSLLAILPVGAWTVNHLWDSLTAFQGNGLATFAWKWRVSGPRASRNVEIASMAAFVVLFAMSWAAIYALWRAGS